MFPKQTTILTQKSCELRLISTQPNKTPIVQISKPELRNILKSLPQPFFEKFVHAYTVFKNRNPFESSKFKVQRYFDGEQSSDHKLENARDVMSLWITEENETINSIDEEQERIKLTKYIKEELYFDIEADDEDTENKIQKYVDKLIEFVRFHSLTEYPPNLLVHLRKQGYYEEFMELTKVLTKTRSLKRMDYFMQSLELAKQVDSISFSANNEIKDFIPIGRMTEEENTRLRRNIGKLELRIMNNEEIPEAIEGEPTMTKFFLKASSTTKPQQGLTKIKSLCFNNKMPFPEKLLKFLGYINTSKRRKIEQNLLFSLPSEFYDYVMDKKEKLQIFGVPELNSIVISTTSEFNPEVHDSWLLNPDSNKKAKFEILHSLNINMKSIEKLLFKNSPNPANIEFLMRFKTHKEAEEAFNTISNHNLFDPKLFAVHYDIDNLRDDFLINKRQKEKDRKNVQFSSSFEEQQKDRLSFFPQPDLKSVQPEQDILQTFTKGFAESILEQKKNLENFQQQGVTKKETEAAMSKRLKELNKNKTDLDKKIGNKLQFWNIQYKAVLEALKEFDYDAIKTAEKLNISTRQLGKSILSLQAKKYDLYLPPDFKIPVGLSQSAAKILKKERKQKDFDSKSKSIIYNVKKQINEKKAKLAENSENSDNNE